MTKDFENIKKTAYPGRVIIVGQSLQRQNVVMYAITGRSPSSQARKLEIDDARKKIFVKPTDEKILQTGNPDLLVYPAVIMGNQGIAVSNGKQTDDVFNNLSSNTNPVAIHLKALTNWEYEPDEPNYTPRISGCIANGTALNIIKRAADGSVIRNYFDIPMMPGKGKMIATYTGLNENPLPSFTGEPQDVDLPWPNAGAAVSALYEALGPQEGGADFRVAAAAVFAATNAAFEIKVINRSDL